MTGRSRRSGKDVMTTSTSTATPASAAVSTASAGPIGRVIATSMATAAVAVAALTFAVLPDTSEATIVGGALAAFAAGWAMLAVLSTRLTTRPQRWAHVPAAVMATSGAALVVFNPGEPTMTRLAWVWAPAFMVLAAWTHRRIHQNIPGRRRLLIYPVTFAMFLAGLGGLDQAIATAPEVAAGRVPGRLVDIGGYRLHLSCSGTGAPTVVLLNGLGETSPQWARVKPAVARTTRVCAYDRAGQGWSDDSPHRSDAANAVSDLHRLLSAAGETGPYVLAGHSTGGVHALAYIARYPREVTGIVLLDSASPYQVDLIKPFHGEYRLMRRVLAVAPTLFRLGIGHITRAAETPALPGAAGEQASIFANSPRGMRNKRAEQAALPDTFRQAQALTTLGSRPLIVLTAKDNVDHIQGWGTAQDQLAAMSTNVRHTVANLGHVAFLNDPSGAGLSTGAINDVVTAIRSHAALHTH